jgi:peptidoglycan L-alanyl-D-glutamate endopeptidase CwlK
VSANLLDLEPETRAMAQAAFATWAREGLLLRATQTLRTYAEQDAIYAKGRTKSGEPCWHRGEMRPRPVGSCADHRLGASVTNARGGYSWHCFGRAFDVAEQGVTPYDLGFPGPADDEPLWEKIGAIGESFGLEWGGRWKGRVDRPHFEHRGGFTLAQLRASHDQPNLA